MSEHRIKYVLWNKCSKKNIDVLKKFIQKWRLSYVNHVIQNIITDKQKLLIKNLLSNWKLYNCTLLYKYRNTFDELHIRKNYCDYRCLIIKNRSYQKKLSKRLHAINISNLYNIATYELFLNHI